MPRSAVDKLETGRGDHVNSSLEFESKENLHK